MNISLCIFIQSNGYGPRGCETMEKSPNSNKSLWNGQNFGTLFQVTRRAPIHPLGHQMYSRNPLIFFYRHFMGTYVPTPYLASLEELIYEIDIFIKSTPTTPNTPLDG